MFTLKELRLRNYRNHRKLNVQFVDGVNAIVGDNGSGKSNILEAFQFVITGSHEDTKEQVITLGESEGYAAAFLIINGKEVEIERHLKGSKVILKYDGKPIKTAREVQELWTRLFQLPADVFDNVIIAKQKEIDTLFNGDPSVREKLFQKIFLVPDTRKIRSVLWDHYIKTAPPEYVVEKPEDLKNSLDNFVFEIEQVNLNLSEVPPISQADFDKISTELAAIETEMTTLNKRQSVLVLNEEAKNKLVNATVEHDNIVKKLGSINIVHFTNRNTELTRLKEASTRQKALMDLMQQAQSTINQYDENIDDQAKAAHEELTRITLEAEILNKKCIEVQRLVNSCKGISSTMTLCPTCGQSVKDKANWLAELEVEYKTLSSQNYEVNQLKDKLLRESNTLANRAATRKHWQSVLAGYQTTFASYKDLPPFNQNEYDLGIQVIEKYKEVEKSRNTQSSLINSLSAQITQYDTWLASLSTRPVEKLIEAKNDLLKQKRNLNENYEKIQTLNKQKLIAESRKSAIEQKIISNTEAIAYNKKRSAYLDVLHEVHEALHVTQFPRKLIQTYAGTVSEYLNYYLALFNFKYTAFVNEEFGVDILDDQNRKLPRVSGGQDVMVGLSLRLALHDLFGKAFPILILDEASYGLNKKHFGFYMEIIKTLKLTTKLKQIILVEHNEDIATVVDHTIKIADA